MAGKAKQQNIQGLPYTSDILDLAIEHNFTTSERLLLILLRTKMNKQKTCWPSQIRLADEMGVSERQVRRLIKGMEILGVISVNKRKMNRKFGNYLNEYRFIFPWNPVKSLQSTRTRVSGVNPDICDTSTRTSETVNPDICDSQPGHGCPSNKQGINTKNKSVNQSEKNDDDHSQLNEKESAEKIDERKLLMLEKNKSKENVSQLLRKYYKSSIPERVDLSKSNSGKRYDLQKYISPFSGKKKDLVKDYGSDFSDSQKPDWWKSQFENFYKRVIEFHWDNDAGPPNGGFKTAFKRVCVSGVMQEFGFEPKSPEQLKLEEEAERKRLAQIEKRKRKQEEKEAAKEALRKDKSEKLQLLYDGLLKNDCTYQCMGQIGILQEGNDNQISEGFKNYIQALKANGNLNAKYKSREALLTDLHKIIQTEAGF